ncbi:hypothetical protein BKN38_09305 [Helicobacter sp. CLO-3]|uniref:TolC family protein n=1 Tax=unclassified Helicobacter TaxID=2593540 RepID=UPI0008053F93|nr:MULTISPECIES: TolC family protein [unclassified Helicobacter]OBV29927.1 hypothetical protein BA723_03645 [Helicobacter sp. CLO-3]OHU81329.1 hypothetical protein BKN38_09305 [Helicobacter sp. CLO-3]
MSMPKSLTYSAISIGALVFWLVCFGCAKPYDNAKVSESIDLNNKLNNSISGEVARKEGQTYAQSLLSLIDDSELEELLDIALKNNTNILTLTSQIAQARDSLGLATANMLPKLTANMGYNYSSGNYNRYQVNVNQNTVNGNLSLSWELDLFGKLNMLRKSKKYEYLMSISNLEAAKVSLIGEVATNYYTLKNLKNAIAIAEQIAQNNAKILEISRSKYNLGLLDVATLNPLIATLASSQSNLNSLKLQAEQTKNALLVLLNTKDSEILDRQMSDVGDAGVMDSSDADSSDASKSDDKDSSATNAATNANTGADKSAQSIAYAKTTSALPDAKLPIISELPQEILLGREDVQSSIANLNAQVMLKNSKKAALFPSITLGGSLGQILYSTRGIGDLIWNITGSLATPLINRATLTKDYKIQKESVKQAFWALENTLRTALGEVENALKEVNTSKDSLKAQQKSLEGSKELIDVQQGRYALGMLDEDVYLTDMNSFLSAKQSYNSAKLSEISAVIVLYKALGGKLGGSLGGESSAENGGENASAESGIAKSGVAESKNLDSSAKTSANSATANKNNASANASTSAQNAISSALNDAFNISLQTKEAS